VTGHARPAPGILINLAGTRWRLRHMCNKQKQGRASSSSSTRGFVRIARAMATRCFCAPRPAARTADQCSHRRPCSGTAHAARRPDMSAGVPTARTQHCRPGRSGAACSQPGGDRHTHQSPQHALPLVDESATTGTCIGGCRHHHCQSHNRMLRWRADVRGCHTCPPDSRTPRSPTCRGPGAALSVRQHAVCACNLGSRRF